MEKGQNFIYDATGITPHFRRKDIIEWKKTGARIIGVLMSVSKDVASERNKQRDKVVPEEVIERMYKTLFNNPLETDKDLFDEILLVDKTGRETKVFDRELDEKRKIVSSEISHFPKIK